MVPTSTGPAPWDSFLGPCKRLDTSGDVERILGGEIEERLDVLRRMEGHRYPRLPPSAASAPLSCFIRTIKFTPLPDTGQCTGEPN